MQENWSIENTHKMKRDGLGGWVIECLFSWESKGEQTVRQRQTILFQLKEGLGTSSKRKDPPVNSKRFGKDHRTGPRSLGLNDFCGSHPTQDILWLTAVVYYGLIQTSAGLCLFLLLSHTLPNTAVQHLTASVPGPQRWLHTSRVNICAQHIKCTRVCLCINHCSRLAAERHLCDTQCQHYTTIWEAWMKKKHRCFPKSFRTFWLLPTAGQAFPW